MLQGNLTEYVYLYVRDKILKGELPFGAALSRRELAGEVGTSIVPVGDALQRLEADGLLESRPRVGTRVRIPTAKSVRGHYILREALETQAARIFTGKASPEERNEIRQLAAGLDRMYAEGAADNVGPGRERSYQIHSYHMRFHLRIAECTGCDELTQAIEKNQVLVFNCLFDNTLKNQAPPPEWHAQLAEVLCSSGPEAADAAMRRHVRYRMDELLMRMEPYSNWSETRLESFSRRPRRKRARLDSKGRKRVRAGSK